MKNRIWEIDFLRGIAIVLMVIFHLIYDLSDFYSYNIEYLSGFWYYEGKLSAILFMLISGISCSFSRNNLKRGAFVFSAGMILTLFTLITFPSMYIRFGILHLLGASMIIYHFIRRVKNIYLIIFSAVIISLGNIFSNMTVKSPFLFMLGLRDANFASLDYYPLLPWLGVFLLGVVLGRILYKERKSLFKFEPKFNPLSYMGQHSLLIYFVHQPVLIAALYIIHKI